jgi:phenylacetate-CoA ligase
MIDHGATVLCCTPTYALRLAEVAATEGIDLGKAAVQKIIVAGEPGGSIPDVRARITSAWHGAQLIDHYGMTEVGPAAFEERPGVLRILAESYFAEIVDPQTGAAVAAGTTGELVLTTLGRVASPAIRYRTGDLVKRVAEPEGFALDGGVIGRVDDMVVVRGVNIYPSAVDAVVRSVAGVAEYRVEVSRRGEMVELALHIECARHDIVPKIERALNSAFSLRIPVLALPEGTLPRFEMKARRWIRRD